MTGQTIKEVMTEFEDLYTDIQLMCLHCEEWWSNGHLQFDEEKRVIYLYCQSCDEPVARFKKMEQKITRM